MPTATSAPPSPNDALGSLLASSAADGLPSLQGSRCALCATETFPAQASCPKCGSADVAVCALAATGTVWTWTVQRFAPKAPYRAAGSFAPYAVAYVDLGSVRVESRLAGKDPESWRIGDRVRLVTGPLDPADPEYQTFWFEPEGGH